ncbi:DUF5615 family PIN-like protein [Lewinella sp. 4G2]|uniref:DUF5615 family PIN-like protein n=1 Tax=Lewinella sp. 4G2 TaxID=1803372 RepID=UPI0007B45FA2|nr:DUF5615 family PIN-like protein [Lewinella sp. 4G2]OAV45558.1 hypothetical protein A3850_014115 [Lewinella sp. 4G2]
MKFLVDTQLPFKLAVALRRMGFEASHTTDYKNGHLLDDEKIREIAIENQQVIITKDADFFNAYILFGAPPKVLYLTFGNISNKALLTYFQDHFEAIYDLFDADSEIIELSRAGYADRTLST